MWIVLVMIIAAVNLATLAVTILLAFGVSRALGRRGLWVGRVAGAASAAPLAYALVLAAAGVVKGLIGVGSASADPSQKARALAEGISEWMNCSALGALLLIPAAVAVLLLKRRRQRLEGAG
jgi:hypothetical protein